MSNRKSAFAIFSALLCMPLYMAQAIGAGSAQMVEGYAIAEHGEAAMRSSEEAAEQDAAFAEGRVYVDPVSGQLLAHPVTAEQHALSEKLSQTLAEDQRKGSVYKIHPDGVMEIRLDERAMENIVVATDAEGEQHVQCGPHEVAPNRKSVQLDAVPGNQHRRGGL